MIRLVIADDHPIVLEGLNHLVSVHCDLKVVSEARDGASVLQACREHEPDVIVLDVSMPGPGILELIKRLKARSRRLRILVLSVHPEQLYARRVLRAGADGYLTKDHSSHALASAIRQVHSGRKYVSPLLAEQLADNLSSVDSDNPHERLSNREYEVLLLIGIGKRADEIAQRLNVSPKTVRTYRARILEKMNAKSTSELIFYAVHRGLIADLEKDGASVV